jgi:hypothetical protein
VPRARVEMMGSQKCGIVGKSQPVLNYDQSHDLQWRWQDMSSLVWQGDDS